MIFVYNSKLDVDFIEFVDGAMDKLSREVVKLGRVKLFEAAAELEPIWSGIVEYGKTDSMMFTEFEQALFRVLDHTPVDEGHKVYDLVDDIMESFHKAHLFR